MKNLLGSLTLVAGLALVATGCSAPAQPSIEQASEVEEYVAVCIHPETENRVDDDYCEEGDDDYDAAFMPYFYPYGYMIHGVGSKVHGGSKTHAGPYRLGFDKAGGSSTGFKSSKKQYFTKGYSLPSNAIVKPAVPKAPQPATPAVPAKPAVPATPAVPAKPAAPAPVVPAPAPKVEPKKDTRPQNNYRSNTRSTTPRTRK